MRLWTVHPRYLDPRGLVALWREGLLARAVLHGRTKGYRAHPQLERFRAAPHPIATIEAYLHAVADEADARGYRFDRAKLAGPSEGFVLPATSGQLEFERQHLLRKLSERAPAFVPALTSAKNLVAHPIFEVRPGPLSAWEKTGRGSSAADPRRDRVPKKRAKSRESRSRRPTRG